MTDSPARESGRQPSPRTDQAIRPGDGADVFGLPVLPPRNALVELGVFVLVVAALEWALPQFDVNAIQPNPCWLPVLLLSLQYGTVSGMLAAAAAIIITALGGFPEQDIGENHFAYLLRIWGQPMLWIAAALLLGQFRMRQIEAKLELRRQVEKLAKERAAVAQYAANLRDRCEGLERQIAGRAEPMAVGLLGALAEARRGSHATLAERFREVLAGAFPEARGSLYRLDGGALSLAADAGYAGHAAPPAAIGKDAPLYRAIADEVRPVSVLSPEGEAALGGQGLAAVPVLGADGRVIGMLKLEAVSPEALGPKTLDALDVIAAVFARSLATAGAAAGDAATLAGSATPAPPEAARKRSLWRPLGRLGGTRAAAADGVPAAAAEPSRAVR